MSVFPKDMTWNIFWINQDEQCLVAKVGLRNNVPLEIPFKSDIKFKKCAVGVYLKALS